MLAGQSDDQHDQISEHSGDDNEPDDDSKPDVPHDVLARIECVALWCAHRLQ